MTIQQIEDAALKLIDNYSQNGKVISENTPNMIDYRLRMPTMIQYAQVMVARVAPLCRKLLLTQVDVDDRYGHYMLPKDFLGIALIQSSEEQAYLIGRVVVVGDRLLLPLEATSFVVIYKVLPAMITDETPVAQELQLSDNAQSVIPFYVASMLVAEENRALSVQLLNQFEVELGRLDAFGQMGAEGVHSMSGW